ncbi:MAG: DUF192 domain-containing protein [Ammonifex sp.]|nr:MAG: DUF192 domain-containing protein [Ammonifex sp.]
MLVNETRNKVLAGKLLIADRFWQRMIGLLGKQQLSPNEGLLITPCSAVHTLFMRFPIDVLFVSRDFIVLKAVENLRPWRFAGCNRARLVIELRAGTVAQTGTAVGDKLGT